LQVKEIFLVLVVLLDREHKGIAQTHRVTSYEN